ncbi:MAG: sensor histidine kinase [Blastocatellia bacterium]
MATNTARSRDVIIAPVKHWKRKPSLMLVLVVALIALLPLLAVLQFRWLGEVSRAEHDRMQASLKTAVANFTQDFDRELSRACLSLRMDARTEHQRDWQTYARRYDQWAQSAPYPQLVSGIYLVEPAAGQPTAPGRLQAYRFERAALSFTPTDWPSGLQPLRARLEQEYEAALQSSRFIYRSAVEVIDGDATALVMAVADPLMLEQPGLTPPVPVTSQVIVTLDADFIRDQMIPRLAARYFTGGDGLDYRLVITRRDDPASVIYQTESGAAANILAAADATGALFGVRAETPVRIEGVTREIEQSTTTTGGKKEHTAVRFFNLAMKRDGVLVKSALDKDRLPDAPAGDTEAGRWRLALQHRAGSLDAAVGAARRRNLAVSFGILLLLSISIAMILVSTRRAERLARQQMEFVAGVSHEMRTPLAVICSAGENLADGVIEEGEQVRRYGSLIESEGRRLSAMIEQALEFAGIQSGRKAYALRPADALEVIGSALAACAPLIKEGDFTVEKQLAAKLPPIAADAAALSRAVQNLLNNAMKYGGDKRWIRVTAKAAADEVQVIVEDRGLGIAASDLPHIFEPFYRSAEVTAAQIHGNGLGLSLVKHIVEAHGGRVRVQTTAGRGSAFTLILPALMQESADRSQESTDRSQESGVRRQNEEGSRRSESAYRESACPPPLSF